MPITQLPFRAFIPDGSAYGQDLDRFENVLPINSGARPVQKKKSVASVANGPMLGAYVHIFQEINQQQVMRPIADDTVGLWQPNVGATLFSQLDEETASDADFIYSAGAPAGDFAKLRLTAITAPTAGTQSLFWRYRIQGHVAAFASVVSITRSGATATVTTAAAHGLVTNDYVTILGANETEYNGSFKITVTSSTTFTYTVTGTPATPATGTITWGLAWLLRARIYEGATVRSTVDIAGNGNTAYVQRQDDLTPPVVDWTNCFLGLTATVQGAAVILAPASDESVGTWTKHDGSNTDLWGAIDEATADDADYVQSAALAPGTSGAYLVNLSPATAQLWVDRSHTVHYRYRGTNAGVNLTVSLLQGATVIASQTHAAIATVFTAGNFLLDAAQRATLKTNGYGNLKLKFEASYPSASASTATQFSRPSADVDNTDGWLNTASGTTNLYQDIDEVSADDATTAVTSAAALGGAVDVAYTCALAAITDPAVSSDHVLRFRWRRQVGSGGAAELRVRLYQGSALIATAPTQSKTSVDTTWSTVTYTLTASEANTITDYAQLRVEFTQLGTFVAGQGLHVTWAELSTPEPRRGRVSWAQMEIPSAARAEVTWAEYRAPKSDSTYRGDLPTRFAGSRGKLYELDPTGFLDKSGAGYGAGADVPGGWYFCSYGNDVIATNWGDPVQYRAANAGNFGNLMTSTQKPKARFACPARGTLLLGCINHAGHFADEVWWSAIENNRNFDPAAFTTGSDYQRLLATPGQVMGLVGGNDPLVFKRRSLYQLAWVGQPEVFLPNLLSDSIGTPFPRSIVAGQGEVFFWGGECFYRQAMAPGAVPLPLGKGVISRYLTDNLFSEGALRAASPAGFAEEDQVMIGAWDPHAGLVVWIYQGRTDAEWRHTRAVVYNPGEDRWSAWNIPSGNLSCLFTLPNTLDAGTHQLKGLLGLDYDGTNSTWLRFDDSATYEVTTRSKVFPIALEQEGRPRRVRLKGVLPIFTADPLQGLGQSPAWPSVTVQVESGEDPRFFIAPATKSYTASSAADHRQWFPFDQEGYFFRITVTIPTMATRVMRSLDTLALDWELRGS